MSCLKNRTFIHESAFHINIRRIIAWSIKGTTSVIRAPTTRMETHTTLGAICIYGTEDISLRRSNKQQARRKKKSSEERHRKRLQGQLRNSASGT